MIEVQPKSNAYDYYSKYTHGATEYFCPADLSQECSCFIKEVGLKAFEVVGGRDFGRVDMMLDKSLNPYVLEVNKLPGMTGTRLLPKAAAAATNAAAYAADGLTAAAEPGADAADGRTDCSGTTAATASSKS